MAIDNVIHVAALARLHLSQDEADSMTRELSAILDYASVLDELDASGALEDVEPSFGVLGRSQPLRADEPGRTLSREAALANAPDQDGIFFVVPKVV